MDPSATASEPEGGWRQHMPFDAEQRLAKARKIISLLERERSLSGAAVLEIGTGTGVIPSEIAKVAGSHGQVTSIDTMDTRITSEGYEFKLTSGSLLPFDDAQFDVVISNHVIEHVGDREAQQAHLAEIQRVLRLDGLGYIATPTRWALIEPHFRVPLLSWLPRTWRDRVLQLARRGKIYDVDPYGPREIRAAFQRAQLSHRDRTLDALDEIARTEQTSVVARLIAKTPARLRRAIRPALPTMIFIVRPARHV